ncbi:hypothetical protein Tco_0532511 [Tanacetum coccineum]
MFVACRGELCDTFTPILTHRKTDDHHNALLFNLTLEASSLYLANLLLTDIEDCLFDGTQNNSASNMTLPEIPNFASVFKFDQRVFALESEMSELKQTNQFAEAISLIPGIVDKYLASKMKELVDVAVQLQTSKLREEAQAENHEFLNQVDSTMKTIIKDQVKAQVSKIMPKIEKYVTEPLGAEVLVRSTNQPQTSYAVAASL